jgi:predicted MFS family arabinose efflux permease
MSTLTLTSRFIAELKLEKPVEPIRARCAVATVFLVNGIFFATWVSRIPALEGSHGMTHAQLGAALFVLALGAMIAMPLSGILSTRYGSDRICRLALLLYAGMLPLLALTPSAILFTISLFGFGLGHGALDIAMNAQAVAVEKSYRRPIMSSFHALWSTGGLIGAAVGGTLAALGLTPATHFALAALLLGSLAITTSPHLYQTKANKSDESIDKAPMFAFDRGLLALGSIALCVMMGEGAMADWSAVYLRKTLETSEGLAAAGYAAFSIAMAIGRFLGDRLAAHFGPVQLVRSSALLGVLGLAWLLMSPWPTVALLGFALVGFGFAPIVPMTFSAIGKRPGLNPGTALATVTTLGYLGFLLGPPVIGFAAGLVGLHLALALLLLSTLLAAALAPTLRG